jgi:hypothetical protein
VAAKVRSKCLTPVRCEAGNTQKAKRGVWRFELDTPPLTTLRYLLCRFFSLFFRVF